MRQKVLGSAVAVLLALAIGPMLAGSAGASALPAASAGTGTTEWAYGGQGWSNGTLVTTSYSATWTASFGLVVIFTEKNISATVTELEVNRTIAISISVTLSNSSFSATLHYSAVEVDVAYANVTTASSVTTSGGIVPALGLINASASVRGAIHEDFAVTYSGLSASASLDAKGNAHAAVSFTPALGLIPLNLTGISSWNSTAVATPSANWNLSYDYSVQSWNGSTQSGNASTAGSWTTVARVNLTGYVFTLGLPSFTDQKSRIGIVLFLQGGADLYDGFVLIPHDFDFFGGSNQTFGGNSTTNVTVTHEAIFVTTGGLHVTSVTAARQSFGSGSSLLAVPSGPSGPAVSPAATSSPAATVVAQPESPSTAQAQAYCLQYGCGSAAPWFSGWVAIALIAAVVGAVAGAGIIGWRSYVRRGSAGPSTSFPAPGQPASIPPGAVAPPIPPSTGTPPPSAPEGPSPPQ
jgi:hypothetical protein